MRKWKLDDFELNEPIGVGTVGTIFRAHVKESGKEVAVKVLLPAVSHDPVVVARFEREMQILERLSHRNITEYFGGGRDGDQLFFAMELMTCGTLGDLLESSENLNWREAASIGKQICSALQYAHNHGIIHRDLKPANLFMTQDGQVKLGDFGIAHDVDHREITAQGLTVGTGAYMAPEQIRGEEAITGQLDLYALGCVLFEVMTGLPPFAGANIANLIHQHLNEDPPTPSEKGADCPEALDELVLALLQKDPDDRPFNARAVQGKLIDLLGIRDSHESDATDVGAAAVIDPGQQSLQQRITLTKAIRISPNVSWVSLTVVLAIVVVLVCIVSQFT